MRDIRLDYIRILATLMVITVHSWSISGFAGTEYTLIEHIYHAFSCCGVPLFFILSGALVLGHPITSIQQFYSKRFTRLLIPFALWGTIVFLLNVLLHRYDDITCWQDALVQFIPYFLCGKVNEAYWFIYAIALLYLLTPFLQKGLSLLSTKGCVVLIIGWGILLISRHIYPEFVYVPYTSSLLNPLGFYIVGYVLYNRLPGFKKQSSTGHSVWVSTISNYTFAIYLMHILLVRPIYMILSLGDNPPVWQVAILPICVTIFVFSLCCCCCWIASKCFKQTAWMGIA